LYFTTDIHDDWDAATDVTIDVYGYLPAAETANDHIHMSVRMDYGTPGDLANGLKTQTVVNNYDVVAGNTQYTMHKLSFTLNWDLADNVLEVGDLLHLKVWLNDVTTAPVVAEFNITHVNVSYKTAKPCIEA